METANLKFYAPGLKEVLRSQGRSARWVAQQVGISETLISHAIYGRKTVTHDTARRIAEVLGVRFGLLFELPDGSEVLTPKEAVSA